MAKSNITKTSSVFIGGVFLASLWGACGSQTSDNALEVCQDQSCSDHGSCAVKSDGQAICICDNGYHTKTDLLACEENVPGDECNGVECNIGGICAISGGEA